MTDKETFIEATKILGFSRAEIEQPVDRDSYLRVRKILRDLFRVVHQSLDISEKAEQRRNDP